MRVTVVIPAYNAQATIRATIDSVLNQTHPASEIIVVDDGSKDNTPAIIESYGDRIRFIRQANQGPSVARNRAVRETASELIAFLDADDTFEPEKIERQLAAFAASPGAVLSYTSLLKILPDGTQEISRAIPPAKLPTELRLGNPGLLPSCVMLSRDAMLAAGGFVTNLRGSEDWDLWLRMRKLGSFCAVDQPLTRYLVSTSGLSGNAGHMLAEAKSMIEDRLLDGLTGIRRWLWRRRILSHVTFRAALTARAAQDHRNELRYQLESFLIWPSPFWEPFRLRVFAVTLRNRFR